MTERRIVAVRPAVAAFAEAMEAKLVDNDHKSGLSSMSAEWFMGRLRDEVRELQAILDAGVVGLAVGREAADVANFAMMVALGRGGLKVPPCIEVEASNE